MRFTSDANKDAIALIKAVLRRDDIAREIILTYCDLDAVANSLCEMFAHGCRRDSNEVFGQLDRYLAASDSWAAFMQEWEERRLSPDPWGQND